MQIVLLEVNDTTAGSVFNIGVANVPFSGNDPVEDLCAGCDLMGREREQFAELREAPPQPISCDAPTDGKELSDQCEHVAPCQWGIDEALQIRQPSYVEIHRDPVVGEQRQRLGIAESLV
jgi:hypothetical protein